jgi:hypothetical protein
MVIHVVTTLIQGIRNMKSQQISSEMTIKLTGNRAAKAVASSY